jgi:hypothetical protein
LVNAGCAKHGRSAGDKRQNDGDDVAPVPMLAGHDREDDQQHKQQTNGQISEHVGLSLKENGRVEPQPPADGILSATGDEEAILNDKLGNFQRQVFRSDAVSASVDSSLLAEPRRQNRHIRSSYLQQNPENHQSR